MEETYIHINLLFSTNLILWNIICSVWFFIFNCLYTIFFYIKEWILFLKLFKAAWNGTISPIFPIETERRKSKYKRSPRILASRRVSWASFEGKKNTERVIYFRAFPLIHLPFSYTEDNLKFVNKESSLITDRFALL